jgi:hypothetical protein
MRLNALLLLILLAVPVGTFFVVLNRDVPLVPLEGTDAQCAVCERKATRTLKRAAEELRTKGVYLYQTSDYPGGVPAWCDQHGPSKMRENSTRAYFAAILAFAVAGTAFEKIRKS